MMEFEGSTFTPDYKRKERTLRSEIQEKQNIIDDLSSQLESAKETIIRLKESKAEVKKKYEWLKSRYRTVKSDLHLKNKE